jgi:S-adenosylmethionine:tRNA ribosyltransferase-isomerase
MKANPFALSSYLYDLPEELIAQAPCQPRDHSRLMIVDRKSGNFHDWKFYQLRDYLEKGDSLIFNDTKVIPARLMGKRTTGGQAEIFLLRRCQHDSWEALVKPGRKLQPGSTVHFSPSFCCDILEDRSDGIRLVKFRYEGDFDQLLQTYGSIPLPPYIRQKEGERNDAECYQTVYATQPGAVAAPTAGLHFTEDLLRTFEKNEVGRSCVTLHVGMGTFRPVQAEDIRDHRMHAESIYISEPEAEKINACSKEKKQICVGTTCCRALETASTSAGMIIPGSYDTNIFIYPGYAFKHVRMLLTNFHLPGSSLLMLVSAFAGTELIREAYVKAIKDRYRFFSYGDAMLII